MSIYGIAVDPSTGNLYATDPAAKQVLVFAPDSTYLREFGFPGPDAGEFEQPNGIAINQNLVFVADGINNRIEVFLLDGTHIESIQEGLVLNGSTHLTDLGIEGGFLWVYDAGNNISEWLLLTDFEHVGGSLTMAFPAYKVTMVATVTTPTRLTNQWHVGAPLMRSQMLAGSILTNNWATRPPTMSSRLLAGAALSNQWSVGAPKMSSFIWQVLQLTNNWAVADPTMSSKMVSEITLSNQWSVGAPVMSSVMRLSIVTIDGCYVVNIRNGAVTMYDSAYGFNSFCEQGGKLYGANDDGVYELSGNDDDGDPIALEIVCSMTDFGSPYIKRLVDAWFGVHAAGSFIFSVIDEDGDQTDYTVDSADKWTKVKTDLGRGLKGQYFKMGFKNVDGSDFRMDEMEINVQKTSRMV